MTEHQLIQSFYTAFRNRDWKGMHACYHDQVSFSDPVFPNLQGKEALAMWHMLTTSARSLDISFSAVTVDGQNGSCRWEARYLFSKTGRQVHNIIEASFEFRDGKIYRHIDTFDLSRWAGMAFGLPGKLLGWTPWMRSKIRATAAGSLAKFIASHPEYGTEK